MLLFKSPIFDPRAMFYSKWSKWYLKSFQIRYHTFIQLSFTKSFIVLFDNIKNIPTILKIWLPALLPFYHFHSKFTSFHKIGKKKSKMNVLSLFATLLDMYLRTGRFSVRYFECFQHVPVKILKWMIITHLKVLKNSFRIRNKNGKSSIHSVTKLILMKKYHF